MSEPLTIQLDEDTDRFARFRLIGWWDQQKLRNAKIVVIGAGALGNEIIKNLALLGIGNLLICDKDRIEHSNLSRSVLYRAEDAGKPKAAVAAAAAKQLYPDMNVGFFDGDVVHDLGAGVFRWADAVIGGLDNRLARLTINRHCYRVGRPWVDGAIEQIQGVARVFIPDGPCYECTMSQRDWQVLQARRSCNLLSRSEMEGGKTPTTPTISSIIAGVQCQETVKLLHGLATIGGKGWIFDGLSSEAFQTEYQRKPDCLSHDAIVDYVEMEQASDALTFREIFAKLNAAVGERAAALEFCRDILEKLTCPKCGDVEQIFSSLGKFPASRARCDRCRVEREVTAVNKIDADSPHLDRTPSSFGLPPLDILIARTARGAVGIEFPADAPAALGELANGGLEFL